MIGNKVQHNVLFRFDIVPAFYLKFWNQSRISVSSDGAVFLSGHLLLAAAQGDPAAVCTDKSSRQLFHEHLVTVSSMSMATSG